MFVVVQIEGRVDVVRFGLRIHRVINLRLVVTTSVKVGVRVGPFARAAIA
jgi:hypothetical protein